MNLLAKLEEHSTRLLALTGFALSLFYVFGVLTSILYSARMGIPIYEGLHPYHILTGIWCVLPTVILFSFVELAFQGRAVFGFWKAVWALVQIAVVICFAAYTVFSYFNDTAARFQSGAGWLFFLWLQMVLVVSVLFRYLTDGRYLVGRVIFVLYMSFFFFAKVLFSLIPIQLGGALPYQVEVLLSEKSALRTQVAFSGNGYTVPLTVLIETSDAYLVDEDALFMGPPLPFEYSHLVKNPTSHCLLISKREIGAVRITYPDYVKEYFALYPNPLSKSMASTKPISLRSLLLTGFAGLLAACVLYILSIGPYAYVAERGYFTIPLGFQIFAPLFWLTNKTGLKARMDKYVNWWIVKARVAKDSH